jgi:hypothetical protein
MLPCTSLSSPATSNSHPEAGRTIWETLLQGPDGSLLSVIRVTRATFHILLVAFEQHYPAAQENGRPRKTSASETLGMLLHWYGGTMARKTLMELFGVPPATLSRTLALGEACLLAALRGMPASRIQWPSLIEQRTWAAKAALQYPLMTNVWGS